ncbi:MAG: hypothetical protein ABIJ08_05315 [Nanoarchaeota archaeon]
MKGIAGFLGIIFLLTVLMGCAVGQKNTLDQNYFTQIEAIKAIVSDISKNQPKAVEFEAFENQPIVITAKKFVVYGLVGTGGQLGDIIKHLVYQPQMTAGQIFARELGLTVRSLAPFALGWKALDVMQFGIKHAGGNIADSYNVSDSYKTLDSYNTPTTTTTNVADSFNGDNRDIGGDLSQDRHDTIDRHDINDSYNPIDNRYDYENDNRYNYDNPTGQGLL